MAGDRWGQVGASWQTKAEGESLCISSGCISTWMLSVWEEFFYTDRQQLPTCTLKAWLSTCSQASYTTLTRVHYSNRRQRPWLCFHKGLTQPHHQIPSLPFPFLWISTPCGNWDRRHASNSSPNAPAQIGFHSHGLPPSCSSPSIALCSLLYFYFSLFCPHLLRPCSCSLPLLLLPSNRAHLSACFFQSVSLFPT